MDADTYWGRLQDPLIYRIRVGFRIAFQLFGVVLITAVVVYWVGTAAGSWSESLVGVIPWAPVTVSLVLTAVSIYLLRYPSDAQLTITADAIEWRGPATLQTVARDEVAGMLVVPGPRGDRRYLALNSGDRRVLEEEVFATDHRFEKWMASLPDLSG